MTSAPEIGLSTWRTTPEIGGAMTGEAEAIPPAPTRGKTEARKAVALRLIDGPRGVQLEV